MSPASQSFVLHLRLDVLQVGQIFAFVSRTWFDFVKVAWLNILGYTTDRCGCCQICARTENELCDQFPEKDRFGICGENLDCTSSKEDGGVSIHLLVQFTSP